MFLFVTGTILCSGKEISTEGIVGFIMVIISAIFWTFQDETKFAEVSKNESQEKPGSNFKNGELGNCDVSSIPDTIVSGGDE